MKDTLFLSLDLNGEILNDLNLITHFKKNSPHEEVHLVTFEKNKDLTLLFNSIDKIHYIDPKRIAQLYNSRLYSDAYSLNEFTNQLSEVLSIHWNNVIDLTNNDLSAYLSSSLNANKVTGTSLNEFKHISHSSEIAELNNEVVSILTNHFASKHILNVKNLGLSYSSKKYLGLHSDEKLKKLATANFSKIRSKIGNDISIIGIHLDEQTHFGFETICKTINVFYESFDFFPVVIYQNNANTLDLVEKVNKVFNNSLICVKCENNAIAPVLVNLDLMITANSLMMNLCDCTDTPNIYLVDKLAKVDTHQQTESNIIVINQDQANIVDDLYYLANCVLDPINKDASYELINTAFRTKYILDSSSPLEYLGGGQDQKLFNLLANTTYIYSLMNKTQPELKVFNKFADNLKLDYIQSERTALTDSTKLILSLIRHTKRGVKSHEDVNSFITLLDELFNFATLGTTSSIAVKLFKSRVECIYETDSEKSIKMIESYLFDLKNDLKVLTGFFSSLMGIAEKSRQSLQQQA